MTACPRTFSSVQGPLDFLTSVAAAPSGTFMNVLVLRPANRPNNPRFEIMVSPPPITSKGSDLTRAADFHRSDADGSVRLDVPLVVFLAGDAFEALAIELERSQIVILL